MNTDRVLANVLCLSISIAPIIFAAGCAQSPTSPSQTPAVVANTADDAAGTDRPFSGECRTAFEVVPNSPAETELPPSTEGLTTKAIIRITGTCSLTHLGNARTEALQRLEGPADTPPEVVTKLQNIGSYTAANGDTLRFQMVGEVMSGDAQWPVQFRGTAVFHGGTGRFSTASGRAPFHGGARFEGPSMGVGYFLHSGGTVTY